MSVGSVGAAQTAMPKPEIAEKPGPDHDGDADDVGGAVQQTQAAKPAGMGAVVDTKA